MTFNAMLELLPKLVSEGLISFEEIIDAGQCAYVDMNVKGFYFRLKDRDVIAERLDAVGWKDGFLSMVAYDHNLHEKTIQFIRPGHAVTVHIVKLSELKPAF